MFNSGSTSIENPERAATLAELLAGLVGLVPDTSPYTFCQDGSYGCDWYTRRL